MSYALYPVAPELVPDFWPLVSGFIKRALNACHGDDTVEGQKQKILNAKAQLWVIVRWDTVQWDSAPPVPFKPQIVAAGTTEILTANSGLKFLHVLTIGGKGMREWSHLWPKIEDFAKAEGCQSIRFSGRPGWAKMLPGYYEPWKTFQKDL